MGKSNKDRGPFGEFLYTELKARDMKAKSLAIQIKRMGGNISDATIRHWMIGSRVPAETHEAVEKISKIFNKPLQDVQTIIKKARGWRNPSRMDLVSAPRPRSSLLFVPDEWEKLEDSSTDLSLNSQSHLLIRDDLKGDDSTFMSYDEILGKQKSVAIKDEVKVLRAAISLIENLPDDDPKKELLIMIQGRMTTIDQLDIKLRFRWYKAIGNALKRGWKVDHIIRTDNNRDRIKKMIEGFLLIVQYEGDHYYPLVFQQRFVLPVAQSFIVAPGIDKGMILFAGQSQPDHVDSAILINDKEQVSILENHFKLLEEYMNELFTIKRRYSEVGEDFLKADEKPGDRIVILKRISDIQRPDDCYTTDSMWSERYSESHKIRSTSEKEKMLHTRKKRKQNLKEFSKRNKCRYIYINDCLSKFVKEGEEGALSKKFRVSPEERINQLKEFQNLLDYRNFEMALSEENISSALKENDEYVNPSGLGEIFPDFCEVQKSNNLVVMQYSKETKNGDIDNKWIVINEPTIVTAFYEHLLDIWNVIHDMRKDKYYVSKWIQHKINELMDGVYDT